MTRIPFSALLKRREEVSRRITTINLMRAAVTVKQKAEFNLKGLTDPKRENVLELIGRSMG